MQIWVLLSHKYMRTSSVDINERRFIYKELGEIQRQSTFDTVAVSAFEEGTGLPASPRAASFPIHLSISESESLFELNQAISDKLTFVMKNVGEAPAIGSLASYFKSQMTDDEIALEQERVKERKAREAQIEAFVSEETKEDDEGLASERSALNR